MLLFLVGFGLVFAFCGLGGFCAAVFGLGGRGSFRSVFGGVRSVPSSILIRTSRYLLSTLRFSRLQLFNHIVSTTATMQDVSERGKTVYDFKPLLQYFIL